MTLLAGATTLVVGALAGTDLAISSKGASTVTGAGAAEPGVIIGYDDG